MSWLNLNDSLNSLKGQITNFASDLLSEGADEPSDLPSEQPNENQKIRELQNLVASQEAEINSLRRQNEEFYSKLQSSKPSTSSNVPGESSHHGLGTSSNDDWFWDPQDTSTQSSTSSHLMPSTASERNSPGDSELIDKLNKKNNELQTEVDRLVSEQQQFKANAEKFSIKVSNLEEQNKKLTHENQELVLNLNQLDQDCQQTTEKLVSLRDTLQLQFNKLKSDYDSLIRTNEQLVAKEAETREIYEKYSSLKSMYDRLMSEKLAVDEENARVSGELTEVKKKNLALDETATKTKSLEDFNMVSNKYHEQIEINEQLRKEIQELRGQGNVNELKKEVETSNSKLSHLAEEKNILIDFISKTFNVFKDKDLSRLDTRTILDDGEKRDAVLKSLNDFMNTLNDYKWKTETLEKKICQISHEKTTAIQEKNTEIEKLLSNSQLLSQEVIIKTEHLRHFENECLELSEKNEMLLNELQMYKNDSGLQTISETNEENVLLLEYQIDTANKRISELEQMLKETRSTKSSNGSDSAEEFTMLEEPSTEAHRLNAELAVIKSELDSTKRTLSELQVSYDDLLSKYNESEEKGKEVGTLQKTVNQLQKYVDANISKKLEYEAAAEQKIDAISNDNENLKRELTMYSTKTVALEKKISELDEVINNKNDESAKLNLELERARNEARHLKEDDSLKHNTENNLSAIRQENEILLRQLEEVSNYDRNLQNDFKKEVEKNESHVKMIKESEDTIMKLQSELNVLKKEYKKKLIENEEKLNQQEEKFSSEKMALSKSFETELEAIRLRLSDVESSKVSLEEKCVSLEQEIEKLNVKNSELIGLVSLKHNENVSYHGEIQRLNDCLQEQNKEYAKLKHEFDNSLNSSNTGTAKQDELDALVATLTETTENQLAQIDALNEKNAFLEEKCNILTKNMLEEQSKLHEFSLDHQNCSENVASLTKELERLRQHLLDTEETYTQELLVSEQKMKEMQANVLEMQQRERDNSSIYTSASIRSTQQVETLQNQLRLVTQQRDEYQARMSNVEDCQLKQSAALTNLQCVLEQFQRDKEKDVEFAVEKIKEQVKMEKSKQVELQTEIDNLRSQLAETKEGLKAASRLQEQLEKSRLQANSLKEEVAKLQEHLNKTEARCKDLVKQNNTKVDKTLIKNLIVGYVASNSNRNKDQQQILKLLCTVLDFDRDDNEKINKNQVTGSWIGSLLHPQTDRQMSQQSLSEAFVRFLESESQPKQIPTLLQPISERRISTDSTSSSSTSQKQTSLLGEVVLPTFVDFAQNRSSSSILKDVLKDNK